VNSQKKYFPKGNPHTPFEKQTVGPFREDLYNFAYLVKSLSRRNMILSVLCCICVGAVIYTTMTAHFKTYVVRVDKANGHIDAPVELKAAEYNPKEAEIIYFLSSFVKNIRTVPLDPIVFKHNWDTAQYFITQESAKKMQLLLAKDNPLEKLGKNTTQVTINSVQSQPGTKSTYQVRWTEETFSLHGASENLTTNYVALFSIFIESPSDEKFLQINPLGLTINDLNFSKES
jgi:type IV secretion system protein VirB5